MMEPGEKEGKVRMALSFGIDSFMVGLQVSDGNLSHVFNEGLALASRPGIKGRFRILEVEPKFSRIVPKHNFIRREIVEARVGLAVEKIGGVGKYLRPGGLVLGLDNVEELGDSPVAGLNETMTLGRMSNMDMGRDIVKGHELLEFTGHQEVRALVARDRQGGAKGLNNMRQEQRADLRGCNRG